MSSLSKTFNGKLWVALYCFMFACLLNVFGLGWLDAISIVLGLFVFTLFAWDYTTLKESGVAPKWYMIFIYPWYVWKKNKLNPSKVGAKDELMFKLYICAFVLWGMTTFVGISIEYRSNIADASRRTVTDIVHRYNSSVDCADVSNLKKIAPNLYRADALLTNGKIINITVQDKDDGTIYVTIAE